MARLQRGLPHQVLNRTSITGHWHKSVSQKDRMGEEQMLQMLLQESPGRTKGLTLSRKNRIRSQGGVGMHRSQDQVPLQQSRSRGRKRTRAAPGGGGEAWAEGAVQSVKEQKCLLTRFPGSSTVLKGELNDRNGARSQVQRLA